MSTERIGWNFKSIYALFLTLFVLVYIVDFWSSESDPWILIGTVAVGIFILAGPVRWTLRKKLSNKNNKYIKYITSLILISTVITLTLFSTRLLDNNRMIYLEIVVVGSIIGYGVVAFVEHTDILDQVYPANR